MIRFRHIGCHSEVIRYIGEAELNAGTILRAEDWQWPDGTRPKYGSVRDAQCPDCEKSLGFGYADMEKMPEEPLIYCNTEQFWEVMKDIRFIRLDLHTGKIEHRQYHCDTPPESVKGFLNSKIQEVLVCLEQPRPWWKFW